MALATKGLSQFTSQSEDFVRIPEDHLPCLGEGHTTTRFVEELLAEVPLQRTDLGAQRGLGKVQRRSSPADAALLRGGPEVEEVVVVQPFHE